MFVSEQDQLKRMTLKVLLLVLLVILVGVVGYVSIVASRDMQTEDSSMSIVEQGESTPNTSLESENGDQNDGRPAPPPPPTEEEIKKILEERAIKGSTSSGTPISLPDSVPAPQSEVPEIPSGE